MPVQCVKNEIVYGFIIRLLCVVLIDKVIAVYSKIKLYEEITFGMIPYT